MVPTGMRPHPLDDVLLGPFLSQLGLDALRERLEAEELTVKLLASMKDIPKALDELGIGPESLQLSTAVRQLMAAPPPTTGKALPVASPPAHSSSHDGVSVSAASLLGLSVQDLWPRTFRRPATLAPSEGDKRRLREYILRQHAGGVHEMRRGSVRLMTRGWPFSLADGLSAFGECGDSRCGCYRMWRPEVRGRFCRWVGEAAAEGFEALTAVRYVTVGCGQLLTDLEVLLGLEERGLAIESIIAIDKSYTELPTDLWSSPRKDAPEALEALQHLASFFAPAPVHAFHSLASYQQALTQQPHVYGSATTYVHCDAGDISSAESRAMAAAALAVGGAAFKLDNLGVGGDRSNPSDHGEGESPPVANAGARRAKYLRAQLRDSHSTECWRQRPHGLETVDDPRGREAPSARLARQEHARRALEANARTRAALLGLRLFKVVFAGRGVAVREGPTRTAKVIGVHKTGDKILVKEVRCGWAKLSEEDDDYPYVGGESRIGAEAWMLIDGAEVGLGLLLQEQTVSPRTHCA